MKYWLLFIFSGCLSLSLLAQNPPPGNKPEKGSKPPQETQQTEEKALQADSLIQEDAELSALDSPLLTEPEPVEETDFFENKTVFRPQVYVDYGKLITTAAGLENKLEGAFSLLFYDTFELIGEAGQATLKPKHAYTNGNYESSGQYYRIGGGYMTAISAKSNIGLGVRYGKSMFEDEGQIEIESASGLQEDYIASFNRDNLTARWYELVMTSESRIVFNKDAPESRINHMVRLGFFFRVRFLVSYENTTDRYEVDVYSIPGYGSAINKQQIAFNLFLKFTPW